MIVFPFGSLMLIWSIIAAGSVVGERSNFHLMYRQRFAQVSVLRSLTISSSEAHRPLGNRSRSQHHRICRCYRKPIWTELSLTQGLDCSGTYLSLVTAHRRLMALGGAYLVTDWI